MRFGLVVVLFIFVDVFFNDSLGVDVAQDELEVGEHAHEDGNRQEGERHDGDDGEDDDFNYDDDDDYGWDDE